MQHPEKFQTSMFKEKKQQSKGGSLKVLQAGDGSRSGSIWVSCGLLMVMAIGTRGEQSSAPEIRTPKAGLAPRINGPSVFGVRPGHPILYTIPASGDRPMEFSVTRLSAGLELDSKK